MWNGQIREMQVAMEQKFSFRLNIDFREGFSVKGDVTAMTTVPPRTHRPIMQPADVQEYDDDTVAIAPKSVLRHRPIKTHTTEPIQAPIGQKTVVKTITTHRVSGSTRFWLYVVLFLCCLVIFNGIVWPGLVHIYNQVKYGDAQIAPYDLDNHHFITQYENSTVKIVVMSADNKHNQVLTTIVHGAANHSLVTLAEDGSKIDVSINGVHATSLAPDGKGGYQWT